MASKLFSTKFFLLSIIFSLLQASNTNGFTGPSESDMPSIIQLEGKAIALQNLKNPIKKSEQILLEGSKVYITNCALCHGDLLDGKGLYGQSFNPQPANFLHPKSILSKPQSYSFWRIIKGGGGMPESYNPWDSAMPAWGKVLKEDEVWKVIHYIYSKAEEILKPSVQNVSNPSIENGQKLYADNCSICHGDDGEGDGAGAKISSPFPRNFIKGHIKFRSTPFGKIPTDEDLFKAITNGSNGTTMPSWKHLSENDRHSLVLYLKSLSKKFSRFIKKRKTHKIVVVPEPPNFTLESLKRGEKLFLQNCSACHGIKGRSDGTSTKKIVSIETDSIWPRNLSKPWKFRRGDTRKNIFLTLRTGLSLSAMPMFSTRIFKDEQIWDLVHYVKTLAPSQKPTTNPILKVKKIDGDLPENPKDSLWKTTDSNFYPLGGQVIESKKVIYPIIDNVVVKALYNNQEIAFYLHWDDPTVDPILKSVISVKESPAPPLPKHLQVEESQEMAIEEQPKPQKFPDSIAIQFPISVDDDSQKPYFLNGDAKHPVNLWKWSSHPMKALEINATGINNQKFQKKQNLVSQASFEYGRYYLTIKRPLTTMEKDDLQFRSGQIIPIAFNAWNGSAGETGSQKVVSSWYNLILE